VGVKSGRPSRSSSSSARASSKASRGRVAPPRTIALSTATQLRKIADRLGVLLIYKSSFDKANRSSGASFRGPGIEEGLRILEKVRTETGLPILTDVHSEDQVKMVADVVDVLQTPAFLARQTDFIAAVAASLPISRKASSLPPATCGTLRTRHARRRRRQGCRPTIS
jgi:3-deoxy-D-manno-octulosonic acid (KDO) 8-phosphate synthase